MRAVISGVMRKRKLKVEQLSAFDLATLGHLICGLYPSEIRRLSPYNLRSAKYIVCVYPTSSGCKSYKKEGHAQKFNKQALKAIREKQQSYRHCKLIQYVR